MHDRINRDSPLPLYHQIAEALRNAIAVGELAPGTRLPSVRDAAVGWGVNLHTVRKAYGELARDGLVRIRGPRGTEVVGGDAVVANAPARSLDAFLSAWASAAREQFGLTQLQLGQFLVKRAVSSSRPRVFVLECSLEQAEGHAREIMGAWAVEATPLVLDEAGELASDILVGTYFHYNDIRQRWPERLEEVRFVAISPDPALVTRVAARKGTDQPHRLLVCEFDESKALNIAADLRNVFPAGRYDVEPRTLDSRERLPRAGKRDLLLVSPRVWGALKEPQRRRVLPIRYRIRASDLESLGIEMGWNRSRTEQALA